VSGLALGSWTAGAWAGAGGGVTVAGTGAGAEGVAGTTGAGVTGVAGFCACVDVTFVCACAVGGGATIRPGGMKSCTVGFGVWTCTGAGGVELEYEADDACGAGAGTTGARRVAWSIVACLRG